MKISTIILLLIFPTASFAQDFQGMSEEDMQKMMQQMQEVGACMQNIDQSRLKELEKRSSRLEAEVKALCASGKRREAQAKAIAFGKEMANEPVMKAMRECTKSVKGQVPFMEQFKDSPDHHVCD